MWNVRESNPRSFESRVQHRSHETTRSHDVQASGEGRRANIRTPIGSGRCPIRHRTVECLPRPTRRRNHTDRDHGLEYTNSIQGLGWLGSRMLSELDPGAEGPGFKSQPRRCRVTVLGKLFTPIVPLFTKHKIGTSPLRDCGGNCGLGGK